MGSLNTAFYPERLEQLGDIETKAVLRKLASAHRTLAELKAIAESIPEQDILLSTLSLQEAKESSAIENIITTQDELYQSDSVEQCYQTLAAKEVYNYARALQMAFERLKTTGLITVRDILDVQSIIVGNRAGFRKLPGTELKNQATDQTVYTPPQHPDDIALLMGKLVEFINRDELADWDVLIKMALIHHQIESIHPFYDGNGRTGRILNILYLVKEGLLGSPVLYLSRYINETKGEYYRLLQNVRDARDWEPWLLYMIGRVEQTSRQTIRMIQGIKGLMQDYKQRLKREQPKIYSHELLNNLFRYPYTKIDYLVRDLSVTRKTASKYLEDLVVMGLLTKHKIGKVNFYLND
ncbi:MAG: Fic family protein, partial [Desulfuromonadales bacterium]|nr:Fic family protein [Desulfuromonadales bacterium]